MIQSQLYNIPDLTGKHILIGVTGSIAAYKTASLIRLFIKSGAGVKVIMTPTSADFISPLTLSTLSKQPVLSKFANRETGEWTNHVELGVKADVYIIAPASANSIAKMANGICDNLLLAVYLSARCPVFISPAMDLDMYKHPSTTENINKLRKHGVTVIDAEHGELASGLIGEGRMAEPEHIFEMVSSLLLKKKTLKGRKALITAGPTQESIDPVRYISNHSTGKMGYALANELQKRGCEVTLISGPTHIRKPCVSNLIEVISAKQMFEESKNNFEGKDIVVFSAAIADYTPLKKEKTKIKKTNSLLNIELSSTTDIAKTLGKIKKAQFIVGFALETDNEESNAYKKLKSKNFDAIVLNSLQDPGSGFGHDTNKIKILDSSGSILKFELKSKTEVASDIVNYIENNLNK